MDEKCMKKGCIYDYYHEIRINRTVYKFCNQHMDMVNKLFIEKIEEFIE